MGLAQLDCEVIDLDRMIGPGGKLAHLREPSRSESVVLGAGLDQLVIDEPLVDRRHRERGCGRRRQVVVQAAHSLLRRGRYVARALAGLRTACLGERDRSRGRGH